MILHGAVCTYRGHACLFQFVYHRQAAEEAAKEKRAEVEERQRGEKIKGERKVAGGGLKEGREAVSEGDAYGRVGEEGRRKWRWRRIVFPNLHLVMDASGVNMLAPGRPAGASLQLAILYASCAFNVPPGACGASWRQWSRMPPP